MRAVRVAGELFITFGLVVLLFCAYELWGTSLYTQHQQDKLRDSLQRKWDHPAEVAEAKGNGQGKGKGKARARPPYRYGHVARGESFALIRFPELGGEQRFAVIQGAGPPQLKRGPGHFLAAGGTGGERGAGDAGGTGGAAMPGQLGNFVVSGHRTTYGAPFRRIDELEPGDRIIVETADTRFTYRVYGQDIVAPTDVEVAAPVPFHPGREPHKRRITLTTCHPMYSARQRLVVFGELETARPRHDAGPRQGGQ